MMMSRLRNLLLALAAGLLLLANPVGSGTQITFPTTNNNGNPGGMTTAIIPGSVTSVVTGGWNTVGDGGQATWIPLPGGCPGSPPAKPWYVTSGDGACWEAGNLPVTLEQFGGKGDDTFNNGPILNAACNFYSQVTFQTGTYLISGSSGQYVATCLNTTQNPWQLTGLGEQISKVDIGACSQGIYYSGIPPRLGVSAQFILAVGPNSGATINAGDVLTLTFISSYVNPAGNIVLPVIAAAGDTTSTLATKLAGAINTTTLASSSISTGVLSATVGASQYLIVANPAAILTGLDTAGHADSWTVGTQISGTSGATGTYNVTHTGSGNGTAPSQTFTVSPESLLAGSRLTASVSSANLTIALGSAPTGGISYTTAVAGTGNETITLNSAGGTLAAGQYFARDAYVTAAGESPASLESSAILMSPGTFFLTSPPAATGAINWNGYIAAQSGAETRQGTNLTIGQTYPQSSALSAGTVLAQSTQTYPSFAYAGFTIGRTPAQTVACSNGQKSLEADGFDGLIVKGVEEYGAPGFGFYSEMSRNIMIQGNYIHDHKGSATSGTATCNGLTTNSSDGAHVSYMTGYNVSFIGNVIRKVCDDPISTAGATALFPIRGVLIQDNLVDTDAGGLKLAGETQSAYIQGNNCNHQLVGCLFVSLDTGDNGSGVNSMADIQFVENTVIGDGTLATSDPCAFVGTVGEAVNGAQLPMPYEVRLINFLIQGNSFGVCHSGAVVLAYNAYDFHFVVENFVIDSNQITAAGDQGNSGALWIYNNESSTLYPMQWDGIQITNNQFYAGGLDTFPATSAGIVMYSVGTYNGGTGMGFGYTSILNNHMYGVTAQGMVLGSMLNAEWDISGNVIDTSAKEGIVFPNTTLAGIQPMTGSGPLNMTNNTISNFNTGTIQYHAGGLVYQNTGFNSALPVNTTGNIFTLPTPGAEYAIWASGTTPASPQGWNCYPGQYNGNNALYRPSNGGTPLLNTFNNGILAVEIAGSACN